MARPKTDPFWIQWVETQLAERAGVAEIARAVEVEALRMVPPRDDFPSYRTIERIRRGWLAKPEDERIASAYFRWPQCMRDRLLPWQASEAALNLLGRRFAQGLPRPTIRVTRWFWRVSGARPDLADDVAEQFAVELAAWEFVEETRRETTVDTAEIEAYLAFTPWRNEECATRYEEATIEDKVRGGLIRGADGRVYPVRVFEVDDQTARSYFRQKFGPQEADEILEQMRQDMEQQQAPEDEGERRGDYGEA